MSIIDERKTFACFIDERFAAFHCTMRTKRRGSRLSLGVFQNNIHKVLDLGIKMRSLE